MIVETRKTAELIIGDGHGSVLMIKANDKGQAVVTITESHGSPPNDDGETRAQFAIERFDDFVEQVVGLGREMLPLPSPVKR